MLMLTPILMAACLHNPSLQVAKDQRHYAYSLQRADDNYGDADVGDDVKRMMDQV
jgi:hypothetical protein